MLKIVKYLKGEIRPILIVVILLFVQAFCDLSLPSYTSNIVNVGIQQGGIEVAVSEVIRESQMQQLLVYMNSEEQETVLDQYTLESAVGEYATTEKVYMLRNKDKDTLEKLEDIFILPMMIQQAMTSGAVPNGAMMGGEMEGMNQMPNIEDSEMTGDGSAVQMPPAMDMQQMMEQVKQQISQYPETVLKLSAIEYVKSEYTSLGMDVDNMQMKYIVRTGAKMVALAFLGMLVAVIVSYLASVLGSRVSRNLRRDVFENVVSFSHTEFDHFSTASLITRSTNDIQQVQMVVIMLLRILLYAPILAVGGIYKVVTTNTKMTWILAISVGAIFAIVGVLFVVAMPKFRSLQALVDRLNLVSRETITGIPVIRAFGTQKHEEKRFDKANLDLMKTNLFVNRTMTFMMPLMMVIMNLTGIMIVWSGAKYIDAGSMQVGDMMAFIQYAMQIIMSFLMLTMLSIIVPRASVSANRIYEVISTKSSVNDPESSVTSVSGKKGYVEFKDVSFSYPGAEDEVLSNISFTAKPGETTAIIGSTGCGKSTLINLIPRFYDATKGEVLVNGVDVQNMKKHELRDCIGYVPQKGVLFSGTIESNIKYSNGNMNNESMEKAARIAQACNFIEEKPEGYDSAIAQGGTNVSGGQKQRLSIARAIAKNPDIYIFDDSFSALDYKTDVTLRKALKEETVDSTVIIVAQRISTILHAEQIIVLDEGRIVGVGTHKELLDSCEVYQQIASSQLSKEELEHE